MQIVEINNAKLAKIGVADIQGIIRFCAPQTSAQDAVLLIDVHCCFEEALDMDDQGGVLIYRHLLKLHERTPEKLKVIFYSPVSVDGLVAISNGENYVLKLMPFIECRYDGKFEEELNNTIQALDEAQDKLMDNGLNCKDGWPHFLCASENLLSGWAMAVHNTENRLLHEQISVNKDHQILLLDDQLQYWLPTYRAIFADFDARFIYPKYSQQEFQVAWRNSDTVPDEVLEKAESATAVISDLYFFEQHGGNSYFKGEKDLKEISGYKVLKAIKAKHPYLPYMMYTGSNKVWNYEVFYANGIWNWSAKNLGVVTERLSDPRVHEFEHFIDNLKRILDDDWSDLRKLWRKMLGIKNAPDTKWWVQNLFHKGKESTLKNWPIPYMTADERLEIEKGKDLSMKIFEILETSFHLLHRTFSTRKSFESDHIKDPNALIYAHIVVSIHGINEKLRMVKNGGLHYNLISSFLFLLRGYFGHFLFCLEAKRSDTILVMACILEILNANDGASLKAAFIGEIIKGDFSSFMNILYYSVFKVALPRCFCSIGEKHLDILISEFDKNCLDSSFYQKIYDKLTDTDEKSLLVLAATHVGITITP